MCNPLPWCCIDLKPARKNAESWEKECSERLDLCNFLLLAIQSILTSQLPIRYMELEKVYFKCLG